MKTPTEKAIELTSKQFSIIARALKFKSLSKDRSTENIKRFKSIEIIAKKCAYVSVDEILIELFDGRETASDHNNSRIKYFQEVKREIEKQ